MRRKKYVVSCASGISFHWQLLKKPDPKKMLSSDGFFFKSLDTRSKNTKTFSSFFFFLINDWISFQDCREIQLASIYASFHISRNKYSSCTVCHKCKKCAQFKAVLKLSFIVNCLLSAEGVPCLSTLCNVNMFSPRKTGPWIKSETEMGIWKGKMVTLQTQISSFRPKVV